MNSKQNFPEGENFAEYIMLFLLHLQQQEKTDKMIDDLDKELRQANRFFPNSKLIEVVHSLSALSRLEVKKGTKLIRCRLIAKEHENDFLKPFIDGYVSLIKSYVPTFDENAGRAEWLKLPAFFNAHPEELCKWEKAYQQYIEHYSKPSFWGYDEKDSDAPPPGFPTPGRINPDGISYLYASNDIKTAIVEVRPVPTQLVSVAQVELTEDIKVYSFTKPTLLDESGKDFLSWTEYGEISNYLVLHGKLG